MATIVVQVDFGKWTPRGLAAFAHRLQLLTLTFTGIGYSCFYSLARMLQYHRNRDIHDRSVNSMSEDPILTLTKVLRTTLKMMQEQSLVRLSGPDLKRRVAVTSHA